MVALASDERLVVFEISGSNYALPIAGIVEVAEVEGTSCIPSLPPEMGGVINFHGDALPVVRPSVLLGHESTGPVGPCQVLVITDGPADTARLGIPVDRVLGLSNGSAATSRGPNPVAERRSIDGRVTSVLDARRLVEQAKEAIEQALGRGE